MNQYPEDYSKRWQVLLAVMTGGFMVSVDGSVVNLILSTLVKALMTDFTRVQMEKTLKVQPKYALGVSPKYFLNSLENVFC